MKKFVIGALIGFFVAAVLGTGTIILAQEKQAAKGPLVVLAGLKLQEGASVEETEKLFTEQLIPEMAKLEGLEMKVLKRVKMPGESATTEDSGAYDYIMMAEIEKIQAFMQLM